jgi:acetylornithine deacetylase/succinyl-diaminopimelate desuccinylase
MDEAPDASERDEALDRLLAANMPDREVVETAAATIRLESHRSAPGQETAVAVFLHGKLIGEGIGAELREAAPGRPNVIGILPGRGDGPSLMFNGHTDTVPPGAMEGAFDPRLVDRQLTGRGACDMKGGLVAQLCAMIALKRAGIRLRGDLIFTGVIAEEDSTNLGTLDIVRNGPRADMVVVAEPTNLLVAIAHKGFDYYRIAVEGVAAHSSRPEQGINAIYRAGRVVEAIERQLVPSLAAVRHPLIGPASINVSSIIGYARSEEATALGRGPIEKPAGGTVPDVCVVTLDHRRLPGSAHLDLLPHLTAIAAEAAGAGPPVRVSFTPASRELDSHPPLDTGADHPLVRECLRLVNNAGIQQTAATGVSYWSDAALFNAGWKVPAIVFGPGDIALAHSDAESVPIDQLLRATRVNALLAAALLGIA